MNMLKTSQGANNALICASLAILGYLFGDWPGLLIGVTSASLIVKYYPSIGNPFPLITADEIITITKLIKM